MLERFVLIYCEKCNALFGEESGVS